MYRETAVLRLCFRHCTEVAQLQTECVGFQEHSLSKKKLGKLFFSFLHPDLRDCGSLMWLLPVKGTDVRPIAQCLEERCRERKMECLRGPQLRLVYLFAHTAATSGLRLAVGSLCSHGEGREGFEDDRTARNLTRDDADSHRPEG